MADNVVPFSTPDGLTTATLFVSGGATFSSRTTFSGGLTTNNLFVSGGATFSSRTTFSGGLTTNNLFVSGGATFASQINASSGISGNNVTSGSYIISSSAITSLTGTTYTFSGSDNGKVLTMSNSSGITAEIPSGLPVGYSVTVIQLGAGQVGFSAAAGVTMNSYTSLRKIAGQHGSASLVSYQTNVFNLAGNLA